MACMISLARINSEKFCTGLDISYTDSKDPKDKDPCGDECYNFNKMVRLLM